MGPVYLDAVEAAIAGDSSRLVEGLHQGTDVLMLHDLGRLSVVQARHIGRREDGQARGVPGSMMPAVPELGQHRHPLFMCRFGDPPVPGDDPFVEGEDYSWELG